MQLPNELSAVKNNGVDSAVCISHFFSLQSICSHWLF